MGRMMPQTRTRPENGCRPIPKTPRHSGLYKIVVTVGAAAIPRPRQRARCAHMPSHQTLSRGDAVGCRADGRHQGIRQIGAILHAKAVSATVVKPFGFATGDWEGSRCGIRTRIALQNPVAQVVVAILWSHGPFATPGQGGCSLGMHGSPPKRRDKKARRSAAGRPSRRFGPPRRSWGLTRGLTHCVRSRLRRELYHPQRSSRNAPLSVQNRTNLPDTLIPRPCGLASASHG